MVCQLSVSGGNMVTPGSYVNGAVNGYQQGGGGPMGVFGAVNTFNPLSLIYNAVSGQNNINGQQLNSIDRLQNTLMSVSLLSSMGAGAVAELPAGRGQTAGGASEFVIPNGPIPTGATIKLVY